MGKSTIVMFDCQRVDIADIYSLGPGWTSIGSWRRLGLFVSPICVAPHSGDKVETVLDSKPHPIR
jgi:hypothetical protein